MVLEIFKFIDEKNHKRTLKVKFCKSIWSKFSGLMFRKNSPPLLFVFKKEQTLSIHSLFCEPFDAIWLDEKKKITKKIRIVSPGLNFSAKGKYLLEVPLAISRGRNRNI
jgi:uncharacterized membrane protein (UPF0127 family)